MKKNVEVNNLLDKEFKKGFDWACELILDDISNIPNSSDNPQVLEIIRGIIKLRGQYE